MRTPNGEIIKAAGAGSTGALHTELLGLGLQLPGASAPLALGVQNHLGGLPGFRAFPGSHRVPRTKGYCTVCRDYGGKIKNPLERKRAGSRELVQLPANKPTSRQSPGLHLASSSGPAPRGRRGARGEMGCVGGVGLVGPLKKWDMAECRLRSSRR